MSLLPLAFSLLLIALTSASLTPVYWWNSIDYTYKTAEDRETDIQSKAFIKEHVIPVGLELWKDTVFVTLPRWKSGVPASLATFSKGGNSTPLLTPYPNWEAHNLSDTNDRIISPFRVEADSCDRLWIMDTGVDNILNVSGTFAVLSNPQVIVYDLTTNKRVRTFTVPDDQLDREHSFFANIAIDVVDCTKTWAYLADLAGYLVVYDFATDRSWRVDTEVFKVDPTATHFNVADVKFEFLDGIFGLALTEMDDKTKDRTLFFHPFSSFKEYKVNAKVLREERLSTDASQYKLVGTRKPMSQANAAAVDPKTGVLLYTQVNFNAIGCWNYRDKHEYSAETQGYLDQNNDTLVFPNDVKVDANGNAWVLSDRMTDFTIKKGPADLNRINFRILTGSVQKLIENTVCAVGGKSSAPQSAVELLLIPVMYILHKLI